MNTRLPFKNAKNTKGSQKCACGSNAKGHCKTCDENESSDRKKLSTESKARSVVATLIGEAGDVDLDTPETEDSFSELHSHRAAEHDEMDMENPEERTEVEIAREILDALDNEDQDMESRHETIRGLCQELLDMHVDTKDEMDEIPEHDGSLEDFESDLGFDK